jgi:hypothetical protein
LNQFKLPGFLPPLGAGNWDSDPTGTLKLKTL